MGSMNTVAIAVVTVCGLTGFVAPAAAQQPDATFNVAVGRVNAGDRLAITLRDGSTLRGRMVELTSGTLQVQEDKPKGHDPLVLQPSDVGQVQRLGDDVWNGLAIGGAIGLLLGTDARYCAPDKKAYCRKVGMSIWGPVFAAVGALIDGVIDRKTTVYSRNTHATGTGVRGGRGVSLVPALTRHTQSLALTIEF